MGKHGGAGRGFRIAGAQMLRLGFGLTLQQVLGMKIGEPAALLGDADGNDIVLFGVDCFENGCRRQQRDFMLAAASAEEDSNPKTFFHNSVPDCWC